MAGKKFANAKGANEVLEMFERLQDPAMRKRALRAAAKTALEPTVAKLKAVAPDTVKDGVELKISVKDTGKDVKLKRRMTSKDYKELSASITFSSKYMPDRPNLTYYGMASILENGRKKNMAQIRRGTDWHYFGHPTDEVIRDIGTTKPLDFCEGVYGADELAIEKRFQKALLENIDKEIKRAERKAARSKS